MNSNKDFSIMQIKKRTKARAQVSVFTTFGPNSQWMKANQSLTQQISFMSKLLVAKSKLFFGGKQNSDFRNRFLEV